MLYWWPLVKDLNIPTPETVMIELDMGRWETFGITEDDEESIAAWEKVYPAILAATEKLGVPAFLRTDHTSAKFRWDETCYLEYTDSLDEYIKALVDFSEMADLIGLPVNAIAVREFIEMETGFHAFSGNMPVNPERRYFVNDGAVICHHPYWIEDAVAEGRAEDSEYSQTCDWRERLAQMNTETPDEIELLTDYATSIGSVVDGYWSVDFCKAADGRWIFIDMATGDASWHPECEKKL